MPETTQRPMGTGRLTLLLPGKSKSRTSHRLASHLRCNCKHWTPCNLEAPGRRTHRCHWHRLRSHHRTHPRRRVGCLRNRNHPLGCPHTRIRKWHLVRCKLHTHQACLRNRRRHRRCHRHPRLQCRSRRNPQVRRVGFHHNRSHLPECQNNHTRRCLPDRRIPHKHHSSSTIHRRSWRPHRNCTPRDRCNRPPLRQQMSRGHQRRPKAEVGLPQHPMERLEN